MHPALYPALCASSRSSRHDQSILPLHRVYQQMQAARRLGQPDVWRLKHLRLLCGDRQVLQSTERSSIDFQPDSPAVRSLRAWMEGSRQPSLPGPSQGLSAAQQLGLAAASGEAAAAAPQAAKPGPAVGAKRARQEDAVQSRSVLAAHSRGAPATPPPSQQLSVPTQPWQGAPESSTAPSYGAAALTHASQAGPQSSQVRHPTPFLTMNTSPANDCAALKHGSNQM